MSVKRSIIFFVAIVVATVVTMAGVGLHQAWHNFSIEDQIHGTFFPVAKALFDYEHDHSSPATNLAQLVPAYIPQIPSSRFADSVDYSVIKDGKGWQLNIHSRALSQPRLYCCRSSQQFTAEEARRIVLRCHGI
ncbi:MAG: hypothetical protein ABSA83_02555 [Verrucomicrobiota bacterium]|jgi:hypothetical protein